MKGFNFEKNLSHQENAVKSTLAIFENIDLHTNTIDNENCMNPIYNGIFKIGNKSQNSINPFGQYLKNIKAKQEEYNITETPNANSNIIDIMMETGTGKTYTYTKTIFELNKHYSIFKFIIVVPTLSIKAGTINFLKSNSSRQHFKEQYNKTIHLHIVESQKNNKSKKSYIPPAINSFVNAGNYEKNSIQVMIINAGMINSETLQKSFDKGLFDKHTIPLNAIAATKPFLIIDEPHKFSAVSKTWENIQKINAQFILRYGATFPDKEIEVKNAFTGKKEKLNVKDYHNLIYKLTAVDAFNQNLVKGIIGHITEFETGKNEIVKFIDSDGTEATFQLNNQQPVVLTKKESLSKVHTEMTDLIIENLNKNTVVLSNGLEMKKGDKINPYSYAEKLQEIMIQNAIKQHFEIEKKLLTNTIKIKPLTLFFIDNIEEYRNKEGYIRKTVELYIEAEIKELLKTENNAFYKAYLQKTLINISATHAGYFSKDNSEKDEAIEKEINEILHDKETMLSLENPRRFIFSKWTLREGWDNPNVFQICKLRSSGSETSKLQEVGRGLRLPVNEYGNRVKDQQFYLNYFVDFTESDFIDKLVTEINQKSGAVSLDVIPERLSDEMIKQLISKYAFENENAVLQKLIIEEKVVDFSRKFLDGGFDYIKHNYTQIFEGVNTTKIRKATDPKKKIVIRTSKYEELKTLWEKLNEKVVLEYKFESEVEFKTLFTQFLKMQNSNFSTDGINERVATVGIQNNIAIVSEPESVYNRGITTISTLKYSDFLKELSQKLNLNIKSLHFAIVDSEVDINKFLNQKTIRVIVERFNFFLMANAINKFSISYKKVSNNIHPTKLTDENGNVLKPFRRLMLEY